MSTDLERSPEQAAREAGLREVAETLLNVERAVERARRGQKKAAMMVGCQDLARYLQTAAENLEAARKDLMQSAYFSAGQPKLF